jgi:hypothetical protein
MRFILSLLLLVSFSAHAVELPGIPLFIDEMVVKPVCETNWRTFAHAEHRPTSSRDLSTDN